MQDRPSATEILATIGEYLDQDVLPTVQGALRYHTLVASNLMKILEREFAAADGPARREREALVNLLDLPAAADPTGPLSEAVGRLNQELQARLMAPAQPPRAFLLAARDALEAAVLDKLAINKPGYERYDMATEVEVG